MSNISAVYFLFPNISLANNEKCCRIVEGLIDVNLIKS